MSYNFSTLNDKDLEELSLDILSKKLQVNFHAYKIGRDQGADLRYATTENENEIIVQVKHYLNSGFSKLLYNLRTEELPKVKMLNPVRYIVVTSLSLSYTEKEKIKNLFEPYIQSSEDIFGSEDLNKILREYPDIETTHFKLWLSSTNVLDRILQNSVKGRSEFYKEKITNRIKIFVPNKTHATSVEILNKSNFILITGVPGVGKSTLADMLTYQLLAKDFELIYVRNIDEAEDAFKVSKKQIFYFDDFLGATTLQLKKQDNGDAGIVSFIDRVKSDKNKRLILTCRTTLLNQAKDESEKIEQSKIELSKYEVEIEDYRNIDKARILYNHIYFSTIPEESKSIFFKDRFYWKVISHRYYNPRIIEFFTDVERIDLGEDYSQQVLNFLENPATIWQKTYTKQISSNARLYLSTLYSLGSTYIITEEKFKEAFNSRLNYEVTNNNYTKEPDVFDTVTRELVGGIINKIIETKKNKTETKYRFLNPSIEDFLYYRFSKNIEEYCIILKSAIYFRQFKDRLTAKFSNYIKRIYFGERKDCLTLLSIFKERLPYLEGTGITKDLNTAVVLIRLFEWKDIDSMVIELMNKMEFDSLHGENRDNLIEILDYIAKNDLVNKFSFSIKDILLNLSENMVMYYYIDAFAKLVHTNETYSEIIADAKVNDVGYYNSLQENMDTSWTHSISHFIERTNNIGKILTREELNDKLTERKDEAKKFNQMMGLLSSPIIDTYPIDIEKQLTENIKSNELEQIQLKNFEHDKDTEDQPYLVDRLFNSEELNYEDDIPF